MLSMLAIQRKELAGNLDKAVKIYTQLIENRRESATTELSDPLGQYYLSRAQLQERMETIAAAEADFRKAKEVAEKAARLLPDISQAQLNLAYRSRELAFFLTR